MFTSSSVLTVSTSFRYGQLLFLSDLMARLSFRDIFLESKCLRLGGTQPIPQLQRQIQVLERQVRLYLVKFKALIRSGSQLPSKFRACLGTEFS